jgi:hypothetical protein
MRECSKCKQSKPLTDYYKRSQSKDDGVARQCKVCTDANYKAYWKRTAIKQSEKRYAKKQLRTNLQDNQYNQPQILHWEEMPEQRETMGQVLGQQQRANSRYQTTW